MTRNLQAFFLGVSKNGPKPATCLFRVAGVFVGAKFHGQFLKTQRLQTLLSLVEVDVLFSDANPALRNQLRYAKKTHGKTRSGKSLLTASNESQPDFWFASAVLQLLLVNLKVKDFLSNKSPSIGDFVMLFLGKKSFQSCKKDLGDFNPNFFR